MTEALTVPPIFGGKEIRVIEKDGETWMPCKDISLALGLDRTACYQHVKRNRDFFGETAIDGDILSHGEDDLWVNEQGVYLLLARISTGKIQPSIKAGITRFRQDIPKFLQMYRKKEIIPAEQKDIDTLVQQHLHIADAMAQFAHVDRGIAVSVARARVEYDTGADLTCYKNLIRKDRQQAPGYLTPTQIGQELGGLSARTINQMLQQLGYQNYLGDRWQPTKVGENYGENMPFAVSLKNGGVHSDYQLKWSRNIVDTLRSQINGTRQIMDALK